MADLTEWYRVGSPLSGVSCGGKASRAWTTGGSVATVEFGKLGNVDPVIGVDLNVDTLTASHKRKSPISI